MGDNGQATKARLNRALGVYVDVYGNVYVGDTYNQVVRKITTNGIIRTIAGNGTAGFSGDNGPATTAQLIQPVGVTTDTAGNVYIADAGNNRIRFITSTLAIPEINNKNSIRIYPNPAVMMLYFDLPATKDAEISLSDITGRIMAVKKVHNTAVTAFDIKGYSPGIYFYKIAIAGGVRSGKVIIGR